MAMTSEPGTADPGIAPPGEPAQARPAVHRAVIASTVVVVPALPVLLALTQAVSPTTLVGLAIVLIPATMPWLARRVVAGRGRARVTFVVVALFTWLAALYGAFMLFLMLAFAQSDYGGEDPGPGSWHEDPGMDVGTKYLVVLFTLGVLLQLSAPFAAAWSLSDRRPRLAVLWVGLMAAYLVCGLGLIVIN
jgi:hypothetical protein